MDTGKLIKSIKDIDKTIPEKSKKRTETIISCLRLDGNNQDAIQELNNNGSLGFFVAKCIDPSFHLGKKIP